MVCTFMDITEKMSMIFFHWKKMEKGQQSPILVMLIRAKGNISHYIFAIIPTSRHLHVPSSSGTARGLQRIWPALVWHTQAVLLQNVRSRGGHQDANLLSCVLPKPFGGPLWSTGSCTINGAIGDPVGFFLCSYILWVVIHTCFLYSIVNYQTVWNMTVLFVQTAISAILVISGFTKTKIALKFLKSQWCCCCCWSKCSQTSFEIDEGLLQEGFFEEECLWIHKWAIYMGEL